MPGGGLIQLVAKGAQDVFLTGKPEITFFKAVYRRHTNFSTESISQTISGDINDNKTVSCTIGRNGDLISGIHLEFTTTLETIETEDQKTVENQLNIMARYYYQQAIDYVELEIGGKKIDKHYGHWMDIWWTISNDPMSKSKGSFSDQFNGRPHYLPLMFWFNRHPGLALPIIALHKHEVKLNIKFNGGSTEANWSTADNKGTSLSSRQYYKGMSLINSARVWVDYIYLDKDERERFIRNSQDYLIDQVQYLESPIKSSSPAPTSASASMYFKHPVKELIWIVKDEDGYPTYEHDKIKLTLNNSDRFSERSSEYFTVLQPYYYHTTLIASGNQYGIHVYSFALKPEEMQPSGSCNFSRIQDSKLIIGTLNPNQSNVNTNGDLNLWENGATGSWSTPASSGGMIQIYATNYNILTIRDGLAGLQYSD